MSGKSFEISPWRQLLKTVGEHLVSDDIRGIIFVLKIPDGVAQKINNDGILLLQELEQNGFISENSVENLIEVLTSIQRYDLIKYVDRFRDKIAKKESPLPSKKSVQGNVKLLKPTDFVQPKKDQTKYCEGKHEGPPVVVHSNLSQNEENKKMHSTAHKEQEPIKSTYLDDKTPEGLCIIISNYKFLDKSKDLHVKGDEQLSAESKQSAHSNADREGTQLDEKELEETFSWLNFKVEKFPDCSASDILSNLESVAKRDLSKYWAFVCCILSHGDVGGIYGTDWKLVTKDEIRCIFKGDVCKQLIGKPKLFFIQACRGKGTDLGDKVMPKAPQQSEEPSYKSATTEEDGDVSSHLQVDYFPDGKMQQQMKKKHSSGIIPFDSDFLFAYGTAPGNKSIRDPNTGTWFISTLCEILRKEAHEEDLLSILTIVTNKVSHQTAYHKGRFKTAPEHANNLRMKLYFKPVTTWEDFHSKWKNKKIETEN